MCTHKKPLHEVQTLDLESFAASYLRHCKCVRWSQTGVCVCVCTHFKFLHLLLFISARLWLPNALVALHFCLRCRRVSRLALGAGSIPFLGYTSELPTHTRIHTHSLSFSYTHFLSLTLTHRDTHTHTHTLSLSLSHTQRHSHTLSLSLSLSHTHTLSLSLTHSHTHSLSLSLSHTHTHMVLNRHGTV